MTATTVFNIFLFQATTIFIVPFFPQSTMILYIFAPGKHDFTQVYQKVSVHLPITVQSLGAQRHFDHPVYF
jgi:hypothetical protein